MVRVQYAASPLLQKQRAFVAEPTVFAFSRVHAVACSGQAPRPSTLLSEDSGQDSGQGVPSFRKGLHSSPLVSSFRDIPPTGRRNSFEGVYVEGFLGRSRVGDVPAGDLIMRSKLWASEWVRGRRETDFLIWEISPAARDGAVASQNVVPPLRPLLLLWVCTAVVAVALGNSRD